MAILLPLAAAASIVLRGAVWSTTYDPGDGHTGRTVGCPGVARRLYGTADLVELRQRAARDGWYIVAMRAGDAACGRRVSVTHRGRRARAIVADRGPYGCHRAGRHLVRLACPGGWLRRSWLDMPTAMARAIGHDGLDLVEIR